MIEIHDRFTDGVIFTHQGADLRDAYLRDAYLRGADLRDAYLRGADLRDAYLRGVNLRVANLMGANLMGANLRDANLIDADLMGADLMGADLRGADLMGANLEGSRIKDSAKLIFKNSIIKLTNLGSRNDELICFFTDKGMYFSTGCQNQISRETFEDRIKKIHGDNKFALQYKAALAYLDSIYETMKES